ncbi:alcohol dehydrogenase catalytic domain-containing protein [candidate division KSB1 bacterium]|nr:alcohol dehydrogenase catalytic domain-containing protein [candidate division KSB1 bacterium]
MKTLKLTAPRTLELTETQKPEIQHPTDVLLKIAVVGICGSDIHYYKQGGIGDQIIEFPFTMGHECTAIVEKAGSKVTKLTKGDHVAIDPQVPCGRCSQCLTDRKHTCLNGKFLGCPGQLEGCLSEYIVMPEECCFKLDKQSDLIESVLVEPLSVAMYAHKLSNSIQRKQIAVLGVGPIGLSITSILKTIGDNDIYVTDKLDYRLEIARKLGAGWAGNVEEADVVREISIKEPDLMDAVFECCGEQDALDQAIDLLKPGGTLYLVGIPEVNRVSFDISKVRRKEICIQNVRRQNECMPQAIHFVEEHQVYRELLITHVYPVNQAAEAFETVAEYRDKVVKAVVRF